MVLKAAFKVFDVDGSGSVDPSEILMVMKGAQASALPSCLRAAPLRPTVSDGSLRRRCRRQTGTST
jgi:Ca2+-binding EF-hand superfamily protein